MKTGDRIKTSSQVDCVWSESRYVEAALTYEAVFTSCFIVKTIPTV